MTTVSIVGCGYWGPNLIRNFSSLPECRVKHVCDLDRNRTSHLKSIYPWVEPTPDFDDLVNDDEVDGIVIATPVSQHFALAKKSLLAGKHTFVEKPLATSSEQCRELIRIAEQERLTLMVGHTFVYSAPVRKMKEIIEKGAIGDILYISSRRLNLGLFQDDINVVWDLAPHDISIILYIMGEKPVSVNCQGKCHNHQGIEDVASMALDFPNGGFAVVHNSWLDPNKIREMTIVGSRRMIVYDDTQPLEKIKIYDKRVDIPPYYDTFAEFHYSYHYGDIYSPYVRQEEPLKVETQHFIDCIATGRRSESEGARGLDVVQVLEAASESLKQGGRRVELDREIAREAVS